MRLFAPTDGRRSRPPYASANDNVLTPDNDATLVRMEGRFLSMLRSPRERVLVLRRGETVSTPASKPVRPRSALEEITPGSLVSVTGVYSYQ